ncbi:hypothetical protein BH10BAC3_BH10BAC3_41720 [soil metagenome]
MMKDLERYLKRFGFERQPYSICKTSSEKNSTQNKKLLLLRFLFVNLNLEKAFTALNKLLIRKPAWL